MPGVRALGHVEALLWEEGVGVWSPCGGARAAEMTVGASEGSSKGRGCCGAMELIFLW